MRELRPSDWNERRAASLARPAAELLDGCEQTSRARVRCSGCGRGGWMQIPDRCGMRAVCTRCARFHAKRLRRRLLRGRVLQAHERAAAALADRLRRDEGIDLDTPRWSMITLTVPHSGDVAADRARIVRGWARLRAWLHHRQGAMPYLYSWEVTPGEVGDGHVHAHVVSLWPSIDYRELHAAWSRACDVESARIHVARARHRGGVVSYILKYATKGAAPLDAPELAAAYYRATYGRRWVSTSRGWWLGTDNRSECTACGCCWDVERHAPEIAPSPVAARGPPVDRSGDAARGPG